MSHDIESDYTDDYGNEERRCPLCDSCRIVAGKLFCPELEIEVMPTSHCDFFRSKD